MQEMLPTPFAGARKGFSADAEVGRAASEDIDKYDHSFSGRQSLGGEQVNRIGHHRKTMSLPVNNVQPNRNRPADLPRASHPIGRRSHSLQQMRERLSIAIHRGSVVRPCARFQSVDFSLAHWCQGAAK